DGMLLRAFLAEPDLSSYSVIMFDEAHERTIDTDILLGMLKDLCRLRKSDLRLIVSSATMNAQKFSQFFDNAPILNVSGRMYDVEILYVKQPCFDFVEATIETILNIHQENPADGDILVFLTGQEEIEEVCFRLERAMQKKLNEQAAFKESQKSAIQRLNKEQRIQIADNSNKNNILEMMICPIYSALPSELQAKIFQPTPEGARKVVVATNIAETSVTIDGIKYVIDCGYHKVKKYQARQGFEALVVEPVSRASALQRKGRAGRTQTGKCYRLYTEHSYNNDLIEENIPEIQRADLSHIILLLKSLGIDNLVKFDFVDPPQIESMMRAVEQLFALGALNSRGELTKLGRRMAEFPVDPQLAKSILAGEHYGVTEEILSIASMLSTDGEIFNRPRRSGKEKDNNNNKDDDYESGYNNEGDGKRSHEMTSFMRSLHEFSSPFGDHLALLRMYTRYEENGYDEGWARTNFLQPRAMRRARDIREQLARLCVNAGVIMKSDQNNDVNIRKAILSGYFANVARNTGLKIGLDKSEDQSASDKRDKKNQRPAGADCPFTTIKAPHVIYLHPTSFLFEHPPQWAMFHKSVMTRRECMRWSTSIEGQWLLEIAPHYFKKIEIEAPPSMKIMKQVQNKENQGRNRNVLGDQKDKEDELDAELEAQLIKSRIRGQGKTGIN
ncbi:MAG: putative Pre-mRNA-splicing factor ATP-dependent RNA helicase DHX16, partial [Streblomastix strix]